MNRILVGIVAMCLAAPAVAVAQPNLSNLPYQSVVGRLGLPGATGPAQAIPFSVLAAQLATQAAPGSTLQGNFHLGAGPVGPFQLSALPAKPSPASTDLVLLQEVPGGAFKQTTVSALASAGSVASINGLTGALTGIDTNTLHSVVANYTIASTDTGKTVQAGTGSTGWFTITVPVVAGFDSNAVVTIVNGDTARAKKFSGLTGFTWLMPGQAIVIKVVNGAWAITQMPPQWAPTGAVTLFVDNVNGLDTNDCLAAGSGNACQTSAQAMTLVSTLVNNINGVTIQWTSGSTYTSQFTAQGYNGPGSITLDGNSSTLNPAAPTGGCVICIGSPNQNAFGSTGRWNIRRFTLSSPTAGVYGVVCSAYSACDMLDGMVFSTLSSTGSAYSCTQGSRCTCANNFTVSAAAILNVLDSSDFSIMKCQNQTITLSANPLAVSGATVSVHGGGLADVVGVTWTVPNSVTGTRYKADLMGIIDSGACNSIPGNAGGQPTSGTLGTSGGFCN